MDDGKTRERVAVLEEKYKNLRGKVDDAKSKARELDDVRQMLKGAGWAIKWTAILAVLAAAGVLVFRIIY